MKISRRRVVGVAASLSAVAALSLATAGEASATTSDYWWSTTVKCQFGHIQTYEHLRARVDYSHNSAGRRNYKIPTYVVLSGTTVVRKMVIQQVTPSGTIWGNQRIYPTLNASAYNAYVEPNMSWVPDANAMSIRVYLTLADGQGCHVYIGEPA
jgi:hypothetical protein